MAVLLDVEPQDVQIGDMVGEGRFVFSTVSVDDVFGGYTARPHNPGEDCEFSFADPEMVVFGETVRVVRGLAARCDCRW